MFDLPRFLVVVFYLAITIVALRHLRLGLHREAAANAARAIVQLLIMGSVLMAVFRLDNRLADAAVLSLMVMAASVAAVRRPREGKGREFFVAFCSIAAASAAVILPMTLAGAFDRVSSFLIPISGMVVGNAMNSTALCLERLQREMEEARREIEARLALGFDAHAASRDAVNRSVTASLIPNLNSMKTIGLVHIPGLMTGMLLSGADPIFAAEMQAIIVYLIFIGAVLSSVIAAHMLRKRFFTPAMALR